MEPQLPMPHIGPEHAPVMPKNTPEQQGSIVSSNQEVQKSEELRGETREAGPGTPPGDPVAVFQATPPPLPVIASGQDPVSTSQVALDDVPAEAADEDLIEKEWVQKAKRVVEETKDDPYAQERAVSKLQADYLQKRYSKTIRTPSDS